MISLVVLASVDMRLDLCVRLYLQGMPIGWFVLLAFLAGIVGHTGLNACLRWLTPLTISFAVTLEPIIGAFIGWFFFDEGVPGQWTWFGGLILITGIMLVIKGGAEGELDTTDE